MQNLKRFLHINGRSVSADLDAAYAAPSALLHAVSVVVDKFIGQAEPTVLETMAGDPTGQEMARNLKEAVLAEFHLDSDDVRNSAEARAFLGCVDVLLSIGYIVIPSQLQPEPPIQPTDRSYRSNGDDNTSWSTHNTEVT